MTKKPDIRTTQIPLYVPAGFYMLRAPALSSNSFLDLMASSYEIGAKADSDLTPHLTATRQRCYQHINRLLAHPQIRQALWVASTDIFEGITRLQDGKATSRQLERAYTGILRYLIRMCTRPTPFGLFSGVALGSLHTQTTAQLGSTSLEHIRTRPDMGWLLMLIRKIEEDDALRPQLQVVANRVVYIAGQRAILPLADVYGTRDNRSIAIRATSVVKFILEQAQQPIPYTLLRHKLFEAFPQATEQQGESLLRQLWENHFLISNLRPPLTSAQPERYVLEQLRSVPGASAIASDLQYILADTTEIDRAGVGGSTELISSMEQRQRQLIPQGDYTGQFYQIDSALQLEAPYLHRAVGEAAADAAETLLRIGRFPYGSPDLYEYHTAFVERYGMNAEVPLLDLLSPEFGLDAPSNYTEPPRTYPLRSLPPQNLLQAREANVVLASLLVETLHKGAMEVELTDQIVQKLTQWTPQDEKIPPMALEMYVQIQAASREAIDRGEWRGVMNSAGFTPGGRTFCRFFDILGSDGLERLRTYAQQQEALFPNVIFAELSYLPTAGRLTNVTIRPTLRKYEIVVNTTPSVAPEYIIPLNDLVVGAQGNRFYIRSLRLGKEIIVTQSHMLNTMRAPNVCRFLLEVSLNNHPGISAFDWGLLEQVPFLPRVVRKNMVLSPAQWNLRPDTIAVTEADSEEVAWFNSVQAWRTQWHVPRYVYLTQADNRLLLDLEHPLSVAELRHTLKKTQANEMVQLQEMLPNFDQLWLRDQHGAPYIAEVVLPLILNAHVEPKPTRQPEPIISAKKRTPSYPPRVITESERRQLPGDEWTYLKIYAASKQHDEIITKALPSIVHALHQQQLIDRWFYIRYNDPEPHLRLRFHAANQQAKDPLLTQALGYSRTLVQKGIIGRICVDSYEREVERYGGPHAIDEIEKIFMVNSSALFALVSALYQRQVTLDPLAVAVLSLDQLFHYWGLSFQERLRYNQAQTEKYAHSAEFRSQRKLFTDLLAEEDFFHSDPVVREQRTSICRILSIQEQVVKDVASNIRTLDAEGKLWISQESILASLAHMNLNRLLGINREREEKIYAFWRHTLDSLQKRPSLNAVAKTE